MRSWLLHFTVTAFLWAQGKSSAFTNGFPSLEEVRGNGSLLSDHYTTHDGEIREFNGMTFTCNGRVTRFTFIALPGQGRGKTHLRILGQARSLRSTHATDSAAAFGTFAFELSVSMSFQSGDRFQILHSGSDNSRHRLLYQVGRRHHTCWRWWTAGSLLSCEWDDAYPLVAVETEPPGCAQGFVDETVLRDVWTNRTRAVTYHGSVGPVAFCGAGLLRRWTVGAYITGTGIEGPEIRILRPRRRGGPRVVRTSDLTTLSATEDLSVYENEFSPSVQVQEEDFINIRQRDASSQICSHHNGVTDTPLISVDIDEQCASDFINSDELKEKAQLIPNFARVYEEFMIFPHMNLSQDGKLFKWIFTAVDQGPGDERTQYPNLQVYREQSLFVTLSGSQSVPTGYPNVYEVTPDSPLPVEAGDFIAIEQPPEDSARLLLSFVRYAGPPGLTFDNRRKRRVQPLPGREGNLPLVTLEIRPAPTPKPVSSSPSIPPSVDSSLPADVDPTHKISAPSATVTPSQMGTDQPGQTVVSKGETPANQKKNSSVGAIVGAVVGILLVAVVIAFIVILLLVVWRRCCSFRKAANTNGITIPMDNPIYSGPQSPYYRIPSPANEEPHYQFPSDGSQLYDLPLVGIQDARLDYSKSFDNPGYYASIPDLRTMADLHSTADRQPNSRETAIVSPNHYEMGIYVPTQEQRQCVAGYDGELDQSIYSTLGETQVAVLGQSPTFFEECEVYWRPASNREELYAQLAQKRYREIPRHQIQITDHLGSGQFGTVNRGVWQCQQTAVEVAVKMLQPGAPEEDAVRFLQEAAINGQFRHPNIVQLLGVVTVGKPVMIVLELLSNGDLRNYLLKHKPAPGELPPSDTPGLLSQFCLQVAMGMEYLGRKAFVHRDLAARNILVTRERTCKISDFGMSRDLEDGAYYVSQGGKIPVKWTAPEALHFKKHSTASDVWSFGCLMYEIWSLGHKPFEGYSNPETIQLVDAGCRLPPPPGCPQEVYRLMITCWHPDKSSRPFFSEVVEVLSLPEHDLLSIPEEEGRVHSQATLLGAPLEAGSDMYRQLQDTYL